jgi:hypothetical protein
MMRVSIRVRAAACCAALALLSVPAVADEGFGFGDAGTDSSAPASGGAASTGVGVSIGGEAAASATAFIDEMDGSDEVGEIRLGDLFSGSLEASASGSRAEAFIGLDLAPATDGESPVSLGEAYVRVFLGKLDVECGLRKLTWGKADSQGPLDAINPLDLTDLTVTDALDRKIPQPMLHLSYALGSFTKAEAVFIPGFEGHDIAYDGRWKPSRLDRVQGGLAAVASARAAALIGAGQPTEAARVLSQLQALDTEGLVPDDGGLRHSLAALRVTTTVGSTDLGFQYLYGKLPTPAISVDAAALYDAANDLHPEAIHIAYNRYHQIGADAARVVAGFNLRAEAAVNLTEDLDGDDGEVYNPAVLWSIGFDRDVVLGVNLNAQAAGSVRLMNDGVEDSLGDTEAFTDPTHTTVTVKLTKKFLRDTLELSCAALWGIEDRDWLAMPSVVWAIGDAELEVFAGFFGGDDEGDLGQYGENDYLGISLSYAF